MRSAGTRPTQRAHLSHHLVTVALGSADPEVVAFELWQFGAAGIEELPGALRAAFADEAAARNARDALAPTATITRADQHEGLDAARDLLRVEIAGPSTVHPPWLAPPPGFVPIVIDPGHAFGSGSHPSTRLALELIAIEVPPARRVVDVGCGTGVLAIAAALRGSSVLAVDTDPAAVAATMTNATRNAVETRITTQLTAGPGSLALVDDDVDLVIVNVTVDVHEMLAAELPPGPRRLIVAGLLGARHLERCAVAYRATVSDTRTDGDWMAAVLTRP